MDAIKFSEKIVIQCTPEFAFDYTQDYGNRLHWDAFLKRAELLDGAAKAGYGAKAYCVSKNGLGMITEYVSFDRPKKTAVKMTQGPFMFKTFAGSWTFKEQAANQTEVIFLYSFKLRFPFSLFSRLIRTNLQRNVAARLSDLKRHIEQA